MCAYSSTNITQIAYRKYYESFKIPYLKKQTKIVKSELRAYLPILNIYVEANTKALFFTFCAVND